MEKQKSSRRVVIAITLLVMACVYTASSTYAEEQKGPQTAERLTIGIYNKAANVTVYSVGGFNPWILFLVNDRLTGPSPYTDLFQNWLAEYVKPVSEDYRTWEIKLKEGIRWHDGSPLTAEDVAFTFNYYREGPSNRWTHHCSAVPRLPKEGITVLDELTLRVTGAKPMPNFDRLTAAELPIIQKKQWENVTEPRKFMELPLGTGPYKLTDYKPDEYYHFIANDDYFLGKPLVNELTLVMIKDPSVMFTALKSGEIDGACRNMPPELVRDWANEPNIGIIESPSLWAIWLSLNLSRQPFIQKEVRQAISLAIDPDVMLDRIVLGQGKSGKHGWPHPDARWTKPGLEQPFDREKSLEMWDTLGFVDQDGDGFREQPDGSALDWVVLAQSNQPLYVRAAEMVVEQLAEVGIKSHVQVLDPAGFTGTVYRTMEFDLSVGEIVPHGLADEDMLIILRFVDRKRELIKDEEKEAIVARWFDAVTPEDRMSVAGELQELNNRYPNYQILWYPKGMWAYRKDAYDNYAVSPGYGIFHKWSFLPEDARKNTTIP